MTKFPSTLIYNTRLISRKRHRVWWLSLMEKVPSRVVEKKRSLLCTYLIFLLGNPARKHPPIAPSRCFDLTRYHADARRTSGKETIRASALCSLTILHSNRRGTDLCMWYISWNVRSLKEKLTWSNTYDCYHNAVRITLAARNEGERIYCIISS